MEVTVFPEACDDCEDVIIEICHAQDALAVKDPNNHLLAHLQIQDDEERRSAQEALLQSFSSGPEVAMGRAERTLALHAYLSALLSACRAPKLALV